jgi:hypothetical protein
MLAVVAFLAMCPLADEIDTAGADVALDVFVPAIAAVDDDACAVAVALVVRERATDSHRIAQKFGRLADYEAADVAYFAYEAIPARAAIADRTRLRFFHAELLYDLARFEEAAAHYLVVVDSDVTGTGEYTRVSAYNAVLSLENVVKGARQLVVVDGRLQRHGRLPSAPPRPAVAPALIHALRTYLDVVRLPSGPDPRAQWERQRVQFTLGRVLFELGDPACFAAWEPLFFDDSEAGVAVRGRAAACHALGAPAADRAGREKPLDRRRARP